MFANQYGWYHRAETMRFEFVKHPLYECQLKAYQATLEVSESAPRYLGGTFHVNNVECLTDREMVKRLLKRRDGPPGLDLFAVILGEAIGGLLPEINRKLKNQGIEKQYTNLLGDTLGTGFGGGIVINNRLMTGDNSAGAEINRMANPFNPGWTVEETLSIRGIKRLFAGETGIPFEEVPEPDMIFEIGDGNRQGFQKEAIVAWRKFGGVLGEALANAITLIDGLVVIGGGLSGAFPLFLPKAVETMNRKFKKPDGGTVPRMEIVACNLNNEKGLNEFLTQKRFMVNVPFSEEKIPYYPQKKTGVGITRMGTSRAVAVGAFAFAMERI